MRDANDPKNVPFSKPKKKGKRGSNDFKSANFANYRRNPRQPNRQFNRGR